jgi:hypothetical protein
VLHIYPEELKMQVTQVQPDSWQADVENGQRSIDSLGSACASLLLWALAFVILYFVVREAVTRGMLAAWKKRDEQRFKEAVKAEQAAQAASASRKASPRSEPPASGGSRSQGAS